MSPSRTNPALSQENVACVGGPTGYEGLNRQQFKTLSWSGLIALLNKSAQVSSRNGLRPAWNILHRPVLASVALQNTRSLRMTLADLGKVNDVG